MPRLRNEPLAWPRPRPRPLLWLVVLLAHKVLITGWRQSLRPPPATSAPAPAGTLVWLSLPAPGQPAMRPLAPTGAQLPARRQVAAARPAAAPELARPGKALAAPAPTTLLAVAAEPPASAASAPREKLLDSSATRLAIRQAGRQALLSERAADASGLAIRRSDQALAGGVAQSAKGDCLQGEFAGGGMGLLSVPFALVAVARGQCAR